MFGGLTRKIAKTLPSHSLGLCGFDSLLPSCPYYLLAAIIAAACAIHYHTDNPFIILFIVYSVLPLLDSVFTLDARNPSPKETRELEQQGFWFELPLYLTILVDWGVFFYSIRYYSVTPLTPFTAPKLLGMVIMNLSVNAAQFAVAHEIMHKPGWRRVVGTLHMSKTLNMHFTYEHLFGHHRRVATPEDPASASKGMNVYWFFLQSYAGAYRNVYDEERGKGKSWWANAITWSILGNVLVCGLIARYYGLGAFACFLLQVLGACFYLEVINYIEHYGLRRTRLPDGSYEKVSIRHSWNSPHRFSNYLFFKLQRHSDHHENSSKPYQVLLSLEESPHLPHGYIMMTLAALLPRKFFSVMDPLVDHYNGTSSKTGPEMKALYKQAEQSIQDYITQVSFFAGGLLVLSLFLI